MAMDVDLILWKLQAIPRNVVFSYNLTQFGEFYVVGILSIWVVEKNNMIELKEQFEGLLRYYVKMNVGQFVE